MEQVLVINPGATSTKIAVYAGEVAVFQKNIEHNPAELAEYASIYAQFAFRMALIRAELAAAGINLQTLQAVAGRGGLLKPLPGGTYRVNAAMLEDLQQAKRGEHASNLGAILADAVAQDAGIPAFVTNPVTVDEMVPEARISGLPDIERQSLSHALNMKAVAIKVAEQLGRRYEEANFVVAHLGTGVSVAAHQQGRMVDVNNAMDEGPFGLDRCGGVPASLLVKLCYSGKYTYEELRKRVTRAGGFFAYVGLTDLRQIEARAQAGDALCTQLIEAFIHQVGKEIGAMATVLAGAVDRIILTGGIAHSQRVVEGIRRKVSFIAPLEVIPGEGEMEALAAGARRVLQGVEAAKVYES